MGKPKRIITTIRELHWPTSDNWYPNFARNTVLVRLSQTQTGEVIFLRLSVWGADDFGMELDRHTDVKGCRVALKELEGILAAFPNPLTQVWLHDRGFVRA